MLTPPRPALGWNAVKHALAVVAAFVIAAPFLWMLSTSLKTPEELARRFPTIIPRVFAWGNYSEVLVQAQFGRYFLNTSLIAAATTASSVAIATLAGYSFARFRLPGGKALLLGILAAQMFPAILLAIPLYQIMRTLGLIDQLPGLVLLYTTFALPFSVWMLRNYFLTVPRELEEAAMVDGSTRLGALWSIVLPAARPGIAATAIYTLILSWNEFLYANTFISTSSKRTLSIGLQSLVGEYTTDWGLLMAGAVITTVPIVVFFLFIQRNLSQGLVSGSVKG